MSIFGLQTNGIYVHVKNRKGQNDSRCRKSDNLSERTSARIQNKAWLQLMCCAVKNRKGQNDSWCHKLDNLGERTSARVRNRAWLQLMCCALLTTLIPNFGRGV